MAQGKLTLTDRLIEGYEVAKKPIAYIVMLAALLLHSLPPDLLPANVAELSYSVLLVVLALILMQIMFEIYEKVVKSQKQMNIIYSNELHTKISEIVSNERVVTIKYLGVAGRHGWTSVLEKLLNENDPDSLIANRTQFQIDIALLDPNECKTNERIYRRFQSVSSISETVKFTAKHVAEIAPESELRLHFYSHMPNMLGFLINDNYLFVTYAYWEYLQGELTLRAGGTDYFVYDKNDDFGGQDIIKRFSGWYDFILESEEGAL
ncbi:hypothetical protein FDP08_02175 [Marinobacter panjinensis]|uniref:Uncharacterized protein n=1 Tax=Marinobacter panjinensis TaxID=2576384 RepID=A0A4U6R3V3_9GAMM|nr:hypothetical protein [Marinobacter panjinensis]TKV66976.1 hypothetical protein FDP08_02175 [Marinobacter panjinensis]